MNAIYICLGYNVNQMLYYIFIFKLDKSDIGDYSFSIWELLCLYYIIKKKKQNYS